MTLQDCLNIFSRANFFIIFTYLTIRSDIAIRTLTLIATTKTIWLTSTTIKTWARSAWAIIFLNEWIKNKEKIKEKRLKLFTYLTSASTIETWTLTLRNTTYNNTISLVKTIQHTQFLTIKKDSFLTNNCKFKK